MSKQCPYCGEMIADTAKKCRYCGEWLEAASTTSQESQLPPIPQQPQPAQQPQQPMPLQPQQPMPLQPQPERAETEESKPETFFKTYFIDGLLKKYAHFDGTASRKEFWCAILCYVIVTMGISGLGMMVAGLGGLGGIITAAILLGLLSLAFFVPLLAISVRRLRDAGHNPWLVLLSFVPIGNIVVLVLLCQKSKEEPKESFTSWQAPDWLVTIVCIGLAIAGPIVFANGIASMMYENSLDDFSPDDYLTEEIASEEYAVGDTIVEADEVVEHFVDPIPERLYLEPGDEVLFKGEYIGKIGEDEVVADIMSIEDRHTIFGFLNYTDNREDDEIRLSGYIWHPDESSCFEVAIDGLFNNLETCKFNGSYCDDPDADGVCFTGIYTTENGKQYNFVLKKI